MNRDATQSSPLESSRSRVLRWIRDSVHSGTLAPGDAVPSVRALAAMLHTPINTTAAAIVDAEKEGIVVRRASGARKRYVPVPGASLSNSTVCVFGRPSRFADDGPAPRSRWKTGSVGPSRGRRACSMPPEPPLFPRFRPDTTGWFQSGLRWTPPPRRAPARCPPPSRPSRSWRHRHPPWVAHPETPAFSPPTPARSGRSRAGNPSFARGTVATRSGCWPISRCSAASRTCATA